jgi:hypothetical protein
MSRDDDNDLIPEPEASADEAESARAESFGELIDGLLAGPATPPALTPGDRDLLEIATMVRASTSEMELADEHRDRLIDRAFTDAMKLPASAEAPVSAPADVIPLTRRPLMRALPWVAATVAAAAAVMLFVTRPSFTTQTRTVVVERTQLSTMHRSRPADTLIGRIDPADAGRASERLDIIFADRMTGYRDLQLRGLAKRGGRR